jgi:hypothetical protein
MIIGPLSGADKDCRPDPGAINIVPGSWDMRRSTGGVTKVPF